MNNKKTIIFPCLIPGLAVIRSLGRKGVPIIALHHQNIEMAQVSKYVRQRILVPDLQTSEDEFISFLLDKGKDWKGSLLFPCGEFELVAISKHKHELQSAYVVAAPDWDLVEKVIVKKHTYQIAEKLGIPSPKTMVPNSIDDIERFKNDIDYPCLVKPCEAHKFYEVFGCKMFEVKNEEQLYTSFNRASDAGLEVMIQELIPGDDTCGVNYNSYFWEGSPIAEFTAEKVRIHPPKFGSPRVLLSKWIPEIIEPGRTLLKELGLSGFSCTEFKRDIRDGVYKFMEVNARTNLSGSLAVKCGINFPWIMYRHLMYNEIPPFGKQKMGIYWIDIVKDVMHLIMSRNIEHFTMRQYVKPYLKKKKIYAIFSWKDPMPFIVSMRDIVTKAFTKAREGLRRHCKYLNPRYGK